MLTAELIVVFLGVYGAFWVENYRDDQDRKERAAQVKRVLIADLTDYVEVTTGFYEYTRDGLNDWDKARQRGETPPPFVFRLFGAETPPLTTWEVVHQAQLAELLPPALLYELGFFYNELKGSGQRYIRYAVFTEAEVLPRLKDDDPGFYNDAGTRLQPRFEAHMDRLREYSQFFEGSVEWASCLIDRLESNEQDYAQCRGDIGVTYISNQSPLSGT
jgi:hypothetical protein